MKELTTKSDSDLKAELKRLQTELDEKVVKLRAGQVKNVHEVKWIKKDIARILTLLATKQS